MAAEQSPAFWMPTPIAESPGRYRLPASEAACIGIPGRVAPMGGVTMGATIEALEQATGSSLLWATGQFVDRAPTGTDFEIRVETIREGRRIQRARATLVDGDREILTTLGALGLPDGSGGQTFSSAPEVPAAGDCPEIDVPETDRGGLLGQFERRLAHRDEASGREAVWFRPVAGHRVSAGLLAVIGDFLAGAHPDTRGSVGFDNTLRMGSLGDTDWILAEMAIAHIGESVFHGGMRLFSESGHLLAITSLTGLRPRGSPSAP